MVSNLPFECHDKECPPLNLGGGNFGDGKLGQFWMSRVEEGFREQFNLIPVTLTTNNKKNMHK